MFADISIALPSLKLISHHRGRNIPLTPGDLFSRFFEFLSLLSPNVMTWPFTLVNFFSSFTFWVARGCEISGVYFTRYVNSHYFWELQTLIKQSIVVFQTSNDEIIRIKKLVVTFRNNRPSFNNFQTDANCHYKNSFAEQTIRDTITKDRPLVKGKDGIIYSLNPPNNYASQFADGFDSCLGYGSTQHWFRTCPRRDEKLLKIFNDNKFGITFLPLRRKRAYIWLT